MFRSPKRTHTSMRHDSLTAAGATLNLRSRKEAMRVRQLRQGWQNDAWAYRDTVPEINFASRFLSNCASRVRIFPAVYASGAYDDMPVPLEEAQGIPPSVIASALSAMNDLGTGRVAISEMLRRLSTSTTIAGESFIVGTHNPETGEDVWKIRSTDELMVRNTRYALREVPLDPQGVFGWIELTPDTSSVTRVWTAHPRFELLADSPMRAILDQCEELLMLSRMVRAIARSRIAGAGFLKVPNGLAINGTQVDNQDPESNPFLGKLAEAMMTPIGDEGTAAAVVPALITGDPEALSAFQHMAIDRTIDPLLVTLRAECIGRIANGLDLPREVITGVADLNHWSAWQVDDNTFRHHVEPHIISLVDQLTVGYLRAAMIADGITETWVSRMVVWYDPTDLVTDPDISETAFALYNSKEISGQALRRVTGFSEEDKPSPLELELRMIANVRTFPPNVLLSLFHALDPELRVPPITATGTVPGITAEGVVAGTPVVPAGSAAAVPSSTVAPPAALPSASTPHGPPPASTPPTPAPPSLGAETTEFAFRGSRNPTPDEVRLSRQLTQIDRDLRARLQVAASSFIARALEKAGARLRTKVRSDKTLTASIREVPNWRVAASLGRSVVVAALDAPPMDINGADWAEMEPQFDAWVKAAQQQAVSLASKLAGLDSTTQASLGQAMSTARSAAWQAMNTQMGELANKALYASEDAIEGGTLSPVNPETLVPTGVVRGILTIAGGGTPGETPPPGGPVGGITQIATGPIIATAMADAGMQTMSYEWVHGPAAHPFEPHEDLDGLEFATWDTAALANSGSFPDVAYFAPGDHDGCTCDFTVIWTQGGGTAPSDASTSPSES